MERRYTAWNGVIPGPFYRGIPSLTVVYRGKPLCFSTRVDLARCTPLRRRILLNEAKSRVENEENTVIELFVVSSSVEINDTAARVVTDTHSQARSHARTHAHTHMAHSDFLLMLH